MAVLLIGFGNDKCRQPPRRLRSDDTRRVNYSNSQILFNDEFGRARTDSAPVGRDRKSYFDVYAKQYVSLDFPYELRLFRITIEYFTKRFPFRSARGSTDLLKSAIPTHLGYRPDRKRLGRKISKNKHVHIGNLSNVRSRYVCFLSELIKPVDNPLLFYTACVCTAVRSETRPTTVADRLASARERSSTTKEQTFR